MHKNYAILFLILFTNFSFGQDTERTFDNNYYDMDNMVITFLCLLVIGFCFWFGQSFLKRKKVNVRNNIILLPLQPNEEILPAIIANNEDAEISEAKIASKKVQLVPQETINVILKNLDKFEKKGKFTNNNISLSSLAASIDTNTKYLSYVINSHKKSDFSTYINTLRINYIISKMKSDQNYLNYKLSYLATKSGFSSHSKFSAVFKSVMGVSPSDFIFDLKMVKEENKSGRVKL